MSIWDNVKKFAQPYADDDYDDYDDEGEEFEEEEDRIVYVAMTRAMNNLFAIVYSGLALYLPMRSTGK